MKEEKEEVVLFRRIPVNTCKKNENIRKIIIL
jgi:hypothetical protein